MKLATMMVALVAAVASLAVGSAFVMPSAAPVRLARNAGPALAPSSQPAPSRSSGMRGMDYERECSVSSCSWEGWEMGGGCCGWFVIVAGLVAFLRC